MKLEVENLSVEILILERLLKFSQINLNFLAGFSILYRV